MMLGVGGDDNGKLTGISLQLASKAAELAGAAGRLAPPWSGYQHSRRRRRSLAPGREDVYAAESAVYDEYLVQPHVETLAALVEQHQPQLILFGGRTRARCGGADRGAAGPGPGVQRRRGRVEGGAGAMTVPAFGGAQSVRRRSRAGTKLLGARPTPSRPIASAGRRRSQVAAASAPAEWREGLRPIRHRRAAEAGHLGKAPTATTSGCPRRRAPSWRRRRSSSPAGVAWAGRKASRRSRSWRRRWEPVSARRARRWTLAGFPMVIRLGQTGKTVSRRSTSPWHLRRGTAQGWHGHFGLVIAINKDKDAPIFGFCDWGSSAT